MKAKLAATVTLLTLLLPILAGAASAEPKKEGLMEKLRLPVFPGAKLVTELNLPPGKLLTKLAIEIGRELGLAELERLSVFSYVIASDLATQQVFEFYEPAITSQEWKTLVRSFERNDGSVILFNEKKGMLIMNVDSPGSKDRELTFVRLFGQIDPAKLGAPNQKLSEMFEKMFRSGFPGAPPGDVQNASRIPVGRPISVPPAEKLHLKATRSDIEAQVLDRNTAEIKLGSRADDAGQLVRIGERLVLDLTPKMRVEQLILPGAVPLLLELTDGSLTLTGGPGPNDRPVRLSVVSTGAPVTLKSFPLVSGTHLIKTVNGELLVSFSQVHGGSVVVGVTGEDATLALPRDASVEGQIGVSGGKILTSIPLQIQSRSPGSIQFRMGAGKAQLAVHVINGNVCITSAD